MESKLKKIVILLVFLCVLGTGIPYYFWAKTDNELSETYLEKIAVIQELEANEKALIAKTKTLTETEQKLATTNEKLVATETTLTTTKEMLTVTKATLTMIEKKEEKALKAINEFKTSNPTLFLDPPPKNTNIQFESIYSKLSTQFPGTKIFIRSNAWKISEVDVKHFIEADRIDRMLWSSEAFNCTDYATILAGGFRKWAPASAFGIAIVTRPGLEQPGYYHYLNFFLTPEGKVLLLEPQNDEIFPAPENWSYLLLVI
ncbi:MAG: hypothetical protein ABIB55_02815 [Candidatus Nealsonbacteria bacterium]